MKRGDKVMWKGRVYDYGYVGGEGDAIIYNEGECNMQGRVLIVCFTLV